MKYTNKMKIYLVIALLSLATIFIGFGWKIPLGISLVMISLFLNAVNKQYKEEM
jgi:hypothetical protein